MYRLSIFVVLMLAAFITACDKDKKITFCEKSSEKQEEELCGESFSTGELKVKVNTSATNESELKLKIFDLEKSYIIAERTKSFTRDSKNSSTDLEIDFYNAGIYLLKCEDSKGKQLAKGEVKIVDNN